uniref:Uncharacterized protein n=1 Tax=Anguilla anguilla TaxID=7936 RepID=A0A0E9Q5U3_ANGAN
MVEKFIGLIKTRLSILDDCCNASYLESHPFRLSFATRVLRVAWEILNDWHVRPQRFFEDDHG